MNLYFTAGDFVKFCKNLKYYVSCGLEECTDTEKDYPVGLLGYGDERITIYFMHYDSFAQAKEKWNDRKKRIHWVIYTAS